ncbi:MAG: hypothetical protein SPI77_02640 [Corynebacterium sp.]|nr:hypothetical protein [Corynebacterium sp.]
MKLFKKKTADQYEHTTSMRVSEPVLRMLAQEMPFHPVSEQQFIVSTLEQWEGPIISSQDELPDSVRELLDLD